MDDRAAALARVAELVGDRFSWLIQLGQAAASTPSDLGPKCAVGHTPPPLIVLAPPLLRARAGAVRPTLPCHTQR